MIGSMSATKPSGKPSGKAASSLFRHLIALCVMVSLPLILIFGIILAGYANAERRHMEREGLEVVRDLAQLIERDFASFTAILETLANSARIPAGEFSAFHRLASAVTRKTGIVVLLSDLNGRQLLNTRVAYGAELPNTAFMFKEAVQEKRTVISDLFVGAISQTYRYAVAVPVFRADTDEVTHVLNLSIDPARIRDFLLASGLMNGAIAAVVDRRGQLLARSVGHEKSLGVVPVEFNQLVGDRPEGQFRHINLDGMEILASFTRMKSTGWIVAHGLPVEIIDGPMRILMRQILALALTALLVSLIGGWLLGRRIHKALGKLETSAVELGHGREVHPLRSSVLEIERVGKTLAAAALRLRQATDAKDALLYEVNHRVKNSLAVVTGILSFQAKQAAEDTLRDGLLDVRARIDVIACVHQRLYESGKHDRVNIGPLLADVATNTIEAFETNFCHLDLSCEEGIVVRVDRATPLALIVAELLTNAVTHGVRPDAGCRVSLKVSRSGAGLVSLEVRDNGPGLPADFDMERSARTGLKIVNGLVRQIRAAITTNPGERGAHVVLTLNEAIET